MNKNLLRAVRIILLALVIMLAYAIDFVGLTLEITNLEGLGWLFVVGLLQALVLSYVLVRSTWYGWKLLATMFVVYWGITVFLTQVESVLFLQYLVSIIPAERMPALIANGTIAAAVIAALAVLIFDQWKLAAEPESAPDRLRLSPFGWLWRLAALSVIYVLIYILFGALVAQPLAGAAFDEYYGNLQLPAWFLPFQLVRGLVWALLTVPVIKLMKGSRLEVGLGVSLLLSVLISSLVIPPNEFMPEAIRRAHLVELFTSMFVFGWIDVWLLTWTRSKVQRSQPKSVSHASRGV